MKASTAWTLIDRCLSVSSSSQLHLCLQAIDDVRADWLAIIARANSHFIVPALWSTLRQPQLCVRLPADVRSYLALLYLQNARRNSQIRQHCIEIGSILSDANVRAVLLKGATWLFDGSLAPAADRMMLDIDVLMAEDDLGTAVNALIAAGYHETAANLREARHLHHPPLFREGGEACVQIHHELSYRVELLTARDVIDAASQVAPGLLLPALQHRIFHNVIHAQIDNGGRSRGVLNMRSSLDLARLLLRCIPTIDWSALADEARKYGIFSTLCSAIHCAHRLLQSPLPVVFADHVPSRIHAWRCIQQRRWEPIGKLFENSGDLARALVCERDTYAKLKNQNSLKAQFLVNAQRIRRIKAAVNACCGQLLCSSKGYPGHYSVDVLNNVTADALNSLGGVGKVFSNTNPEHQVRVLAYTRELNPQHSVSQQIAGEHSYLHTPAILRPFLNHSLCISSIISLAGSHLTCLCLKPNSRRDLQISPENFVGSELDPARDSFTPCWIPCSGVGDQSSVVNKDSTLWELADLAERLCPSQPTNTCLLLTDRQLELLMPSAAEVFPFSIIVVLSVKSGGKANAILDWRMQRALFDQGLVAIGAVAVEEGTAHCFLASDAVRAINQLGGASHGAVSMSTLGSNGRFANQLFQYAYVKLYALRHGLEPLLPSWDGNKLFGLNDKSCRGLSYPEVRFGGFDDSDRLLWEMDEPPIDIDLFGYFQELPACWERHRSLLRRLFQLVPDYADVIEGWYENVRRNGERTLVAVHVRRADYRRFDGMPWYRLVPEDWYVSWLRNIWPTLRDPILFVATDEPETVLPFFNEFTSLATRASLRNYITDFEMLRRADYLAIANSSFSRMAAILGADSQQCVCPSFETRTFVPYYPWLDPGFWPRYSDGLHVGKRLQPGSQCVVRG